MDHRSKRPAYHLTAWKNWCNDPNGLIRIGDVFHAFYQHYPEAPVWGPMHWGHAVSRDLYRWEHRPIALFPTSEGSCFSGSAVWDRTQTAGLTEDAEGPIILHYTLDPGQGGEAEGASRGQVQCIAYSTDGDRFLPYDGNPVLENPGIPDFRDPKVIRYTPDNIWVSAVAAGDHIAFYRSEDLLTWEHAGDFGPGEGDIEGVWECPDLFPACHGGPDILGAARFDGDR